MDLKLTFISDTSASIPGLKTASSFEIARGVGVVVERFAFSRPPITPHFPWLIAPLTCMVSSTARSTFASMGSRKSAAGPALLFYSLFTSPLIQQPFSSPGCLARGLDFFERASFFFCLLLCFSDIQIARALPQQGTATTAQQRQSDTKR